MNEWINDEAVYRTAPATPGLLISNLWLPGLKTYKTKLRIVAGDHDFEKVQC